MTGRSKANFMTRATAILAAAFILSSLGLGILISQGKHEGTIAERIAKEGATGKDNVIPGAGLKSQQPAPTPAAPDVGKEKAADKLGVAPATAPSSVPQPGSEAAPVQPAAPAQPQSAPSVPKPE
jgi:preprotein translocase subunit SecG